MGHLVNPITYRLGISKCWNSAWSKNVYSDYSFLLKNDSSIYSFFQRFFDLQFIIQSGYIFSHVKIIREYSCVFFVIYFYDGGSLERSDIMRHLFLSDDFQIFTLTNIFFLSLSSFLKLYHWNFSGFKILRNFKFIFLHQYFVGRKNLLNLKLKLRKFAVSSLCLLIKTKLRMFLVLNLQLAEKSFFNFSNFSKNFDDALSSGGLLSFFFSSVCLFLLNLVDYSFFFSILFMLHKMFNLFKIFRILQFRKMFKSFFLMRWKMILKIRYFTKLIRTLLRYFSFTRYFLHYLGDFFFFSIRINSRLKHLLSTIFYKSLLSKGLFKTRVILKKLEVTELTANIVSKYLSVRLRQRFQLKEALFPVLRHLSHTFFIRGFRIVCAGRFTRKEIALYDLRTYSSVPFSGVSSFLDFSLSEVILKYSICGIKVWLHKHIVSENFFSIYGIGLNFIQKPEISQNFLKFLQSRLDVISKPYDENFFNKKIFKFLTKIFIKKIRKKKTRLSRNFTGVRNLFAKYSFRFLPAVDFIFINLNVFKKHLKPKRNYRKTHMKKIN